MPKYEWVDAEQALSTMAANDSKIHSLVGQGSVTMTDPKGQTARLETAMAAVYPDYLRLRAWKMGQAVFDLTLKPEGLWLMIPEEMKKKETLIPAGTGAAQFAKGISSLHAAFFNDIGLQIVENTRTTFAVERRYDNGTNVRCDIDHDTLTILKHTITSPDGKQYSIRYDRYDQINDAVVPRRIIAKGEKGTILIEFDDLQVNVPTASGAFIPPKRAERMP